MTSEDACSTSRQQDSSAAERRCNAAHRQHCYQFVRDLAHDTTVSDRLEAAGVRQA